MFYEVIRSGSDGNCVIMDNIMVDCGVPYGELRDYLPCVKYLIITHKHKDHINKNTLNMIKLVYPNIEILGNIEVDLEVGVDIVIHTGFSVNVEDYSFKFFELDHSVLNHGFTFTSKDGSSVIYATDTACMDNAPQTKYDYIFLESCYCEDMLSLKNNWAKTVNWTPYVRFEKHFSKQEALAFYKLYRRCETSVFVELHKSTEFYRTPSQVEYNKGLVIGC